MTSKEVVSLGLFSCHQPKAEDDDPEPILKSERIKHTISSGSWILKKKRKPGREKKQKQKKRHFSHKGHFIGNTSGGMPLFFYFSPLTISTQHRGAGRGSADKNLMFEGIGSNSQQAGLRICRQMHCLPICEKPSWSPFFGTRNVDNGRWERRKKHFLKLNELIVTDFKYIIANLEKNIRICKSFVSNWCWLVV